MCVRVSVQVAYVPMFQLTYKVTNVMESHGSYVMETSEHTLLACILLVDVKHVTFTHVGHIVPLYETRSIMAAVRYKSI